MWLGIISLFPSMFSALEKGITGRAIEKKIIELSYWNPRDYTIDKHKRVDDRPYGGGPGMVMAVRPLRDAIHAAKETGPAKVIYLSPQGNVLTQARVANLSKQKRLILISGRYEGIDERLIATEVDEEYSIGDYVLSGGELASMVLIDAVTRLLPGALGDEDSAQQDSFTVGLLDCPHYTRPEHVAGISVPPVLMQGDHQAIACWRLQQSLGRTWQRRPDLLSNRQLTKEQEILLNEFIRLQTHEA